jgi:hypothetical protein
MFSRVFVALDDAQIRLDMQATNRSTLKRYHMVYDM